MREFHEQAFYNKRTREEMKDGFVKEYIRDFWDWYTDNLKTAPRLPGERWMTGYSELGARKMRNAARRGIGAYYRARGRFPDFQAPRDYTQMTLLNSIIAPMPRVIPADKLNVGTFIPENLRDRVRPAKVHRVFDSAEALSDEGLAPGSYYLKANHGSAQALQITAPFGDAQLSEAREKAGNWLAKSYGTHSSQWWYRLIDRKIYLEEDLRETPDQPIPDFRFHVINGKVALLQLDLGLGTDNRNNPVFDGDLNYLPHNFLRDNLGEVDLPAQAGFARDAAREIGAQFPYVRVDFYLRGDDLFLGELTFLPNSGRRRIRSKELNEMLCSYWDPMPQVVAIDSIAAQQAAE